MENKPHIMQQVSICLSDGDDIDCYLLNRCPTIAGESLYWIFTSTDRKIIVLNSYYRREISSIDRSTLIQNAREDHKKFKNNDGFIYYTPIEQYTSYPGTTFYRTYVFYPRERHLINVHHIKYIRCGDERLLMNDEHMIEFLTADMGL